MINQDEYFEEVDDVENDDAQEQEIVSVRSINRRGRGRPAHTAARVQKFQNKRNNRVDREIDRNVKAMKGDIDYRPWSNDPFELPYSVYERFEKAGYVLHFCPLDDIMIRAREKEGFVGVQLHEVPEWTVSAIPSVNASHGSLFKDFVVCIDQILMKIPVERYNMIKKTVQAERDFNNRIVRKALKNSRDPASLSQADAFTLSRPD